MPIDKKKYKQEFKRQKAKGKKFGEADKIAMKHAKLPYKVKPLVKYKSKIKFKPKLKIKSKIKEDISPKEKLRRKILKAQERYKPKPKPKLKPKPKSLLQKTRERIKKLFARKKQKPHTTTRTKSAEKQLGRSISKKEIAKLRGKKK